MNEYPEDTELIQALVRFAGTNPASVAKRAGVAVSTVNRPFNGSAQNRLGRAVLEKLRRAFPDFPGWEDIPGPLAAADRRLAFHGAAPERDPDLVEIEEIDLRFGLGGTYLDASATGEKRVFSRAWLRNFTQAAPQHLFWAVGDGDSMEPTIRSGEVVLIDSSQNRLQTDDCIWAIAIGDVGKIKRLRHGRDGGVKILSDNPAVPPDDAYDGEMNIIGRVVAVVRRL